MQNNNGYGYQPTANFPEIPVAPTTGSNAVKPVGGLAMDKLQRAFENLTMIIDIGFDYDGFKKAKDLKELIDELVDYARKAKMDLREYLIANKILER